MCVWVVCHLVLSVEERIGQGGIRVLRIPSETREAGRAVGWGAEAAHRLRLPRQGGAARPGCGRHSGRSVVVEGPLFQELGFVAVLKAVLIEISSVAPSSLELPNTQFAAVLGPSCPSVDIRPRAASSLLLCILSGLAG